MVGSKCNLSKIRGIPSPTNRGPQNDFFGPLRNLRATLTAYVFGMKRNIDNRSSVLTTTRGLLHRPKMSWTFVHKWLKTGPAFLPTLRKFCILLHCHASQTETSKRTQPNFAKKWVVSRPNKMLYNSRSRPSHKNWGPKNFSICSVFRRLRDSMANIFWRKHDNRKRAFESTRGFLHRLKISWTLVHKRLKIGSEFSSTLRKFCIVLLMRCTRKPNPTKRRQMGRNGADASRIRWRRMVNVNVTIEIRSLVSEARKNISS